VSQMIPYSRVTFVEFVPFNTENKAVVGHVTWTQKSNERPAEKIAHDICVKNINDQVRIIKLNFS
jgi:hypothetical protein